MRLLLDTHVALWWWNNDRRLSTQARQAIASGGNDAALSAASVWEIQIKRALGKLQAPDDLTKMMRRHRFSALSVTVDHALAAGALPRHHDDPFDRMLVVQAMTEGLTLVSADRRLGAYNVALLPA